MSQADFRTQSSVMFDRLMRLDGPVKKAADMVSVLAWQERAFADNQEKMCKNLTNLYFTSYLTEQGLNKTNMVSR